MEIDQVRCLMRLSKIWKAHTCEWRSSTHYFLRAELERGVPLEKNHAGVILLIRTNTCHILKITSAIKLLNKLITLVCLTLIVSSCLLLMRIISEDRIYINLKRCWLEKGWWFRLTSSIFGMSVGDMCR